ncbi:hypothetical protein ACFB49_04360 [Sphingomonas sp. DBB INV C78]|uniref:glycerophosphoryl diester phosphodiesterase membrane domain-containing protein n=1 Tax=Sphingomonas sp. DBB INV C78 TaxID=3349434 RepID=UPI0036D35A29
MTETTLTGGAILSRTFELLRGNAMPAVIASLVLGVVTLANGAVSAAVSIFAEYTIVAGLLSAADLMPDGYRTRRFWAILGLGILSGLAIMAGFALLIVPGVFLLVRWVTCVPVLIGEETGVFEAMRRSWQETTGHFWSIFFALAVIYAPLVLVVGFASVATYQAGGVQPSLSLTLPLNIVSSAVVVVSWHAAVAIYAILRSNAPRLEEVFA